jgi:hypothetical protein
MSTTQEQARALMQRHHQLVKNRQQSMLSRASAEAGILNEVTDYHEIQGKPYADSREVYDRSSATFS